MRRILLLPLLCMSALAADTVRIELVLPDAAPGLWHASRAFVDVPEGATGPALIATPQSVRPVDVRTGSVALSFGIDEKGVPFNIQVDKSSDKALEDEVIAMIREWRFEAAMRNGFPIISYGYMDFVLGDRPDGIRRPVRATKKK